MSYLNSTRFTFSGLFQANISTVNNYHDNYEPSVHGTKVGQGNQNQNWNPNGDGLFGLRNCVINSAYLNDAEDTSLNGMTVQSIDTPFKGAMSDLDNQQQHVSELWALRISIGPEDAPYFQANYKAAAFADIWYTRTSLGPGAFYQSVLTDIQWGTNIPVGVLSALKTIAEQNGNMLSIKFNVDNFAHTNPNSDLNCTGRLVGTIGPYIQGEPMHFVNGRCLAPATPDNPLSNQWFAYASVDTTNQKLYLDMGNSLQFTTPDTINDYGTLTLQLQTPGAPTTIGTINYSETNAYVTNAFIQEFDISTCVNDINLYPLVVYSSNANGNILSEAASGHFVRADQFVFRMEANSQATVDFYASKFGQSLSGQSIALNIAPNTASEGPFSQGGDGEDDNPPLQTPMSAFTINGATTLPTSVNIDAGKITVSLSSGDPGNPRGYMDGQMYGVQYYIQGDTPPTTPTPSAYVNVHVYDACDVESPTYYQDVKSILDQYGWLYPVMGSYVDLSDYRSLYANKNVLKTVFSAAITDPIHMPVTRDLSQAKAAMLVQWIDNDCPMGTPSINVTVQANVKWQDSGYIVESGGASSVSIVYQSGQWTANPSTGFVDANGNPSLIAKPGYTLPGANEGALCGRIGESGEVFLIGDNGQVPANLIGTLYLCINDDLNGEYGPGFSDNQGSITVQISENS